MAACAAIFILNSSFRMLRQIKGIIDFNSLVTQSVFQSGVSE